MMTLDLFEQWCGGVHRGQVHPVNGRRDPATPVSPWCACDPAYSERGLVAHDCPLGVVEEYVEALQELGLTIREDR